MKESEIMDPKTTKTTLNQAEKKKTQPAGRPNTDNITLNQGKECPPQATPAALKPWGATVGNSDTQNSDAVHACGHALLLLMYRECSCASTHCVPWQHAV
jgi:hypothetical protein